MSSYVIPLLILAPGLLQARQINTPVSQMDIAPTVLGLQGFPYAAPFFGKNMLIENEAPSVLLFKLNHDVSLYSDMQLVVLGLRHTVKTYEYHLNSKELKETNNDPTLKQLAVAYYQNAFDLFKKYNYR